MPRVGPPAGFVVTATFRTWGRLYDAGAVAHGYSAKASHDFLIALQTIIVEQVAMDGAVFIPKLGTFRRVENTRLIYGASWRPKKRHRVYRYKLKFDPHESLNVAIN